MLEITGNIISELSDVDLRTLIGLLCEAELLAIGLPIAGVTWGGHQNAKDGGIDVRVELTTDLHVDSFIPRANTGFQVKKPDIPRSSIIDEMRPNGKLRQVIKELADKSGCYIIVSGQGSTADSALKERRAAMKEALCDYPNASNIKLDFYDRERVAGWVRSHTSLILWVRDRIGQPILGWRPYDNWAKSPGGIEEEYILDGQIRLRNSSDYNSNGLSAVDGINNLRKILQSSRSCVRLVGLSGLGKTRLVQALFDGRVGERPLNQFQVSYCDISDSPNPNPLNFAERLISHKKPAILIIDNCPPELHRNLTKVCSVIGSLVSLITIEYDVKDDQPEETEVFHLEPASNEIIKKIIFSRFKYVSKIDASTIAKISGGNSRIAIALANTIQRGENLANLRDADLFMRLFQQRNEQDKSLLRTAEACSLVYSFDCQTAEGANDELRLLGSLIGMSVREVYENVSELKRRDLVQQRGVWRSVLPHAIANKLGKRALENISLDDIYSVFEKSGSERLLKSFSRRLSYLHECDAARKLSEKWLSENGLLGDVSNLNDLKISLFKNIAPVNPVLALTAIEMVLKHKEADMFFSRENAHYTEFTRLLRSLAYDKDLFNRSVELLCRFALSESPGENNSSIRDLLESLFYIHLSGTHATVEQRLCIISNLMYSNNNEKINLSISLLSASLEAYHFTSHYEFEFGARSRDYGYTPRNREDIQYWFKIFIEFSVTLAISNEHIAYRIKELLAKKFIGLWSEEKMYDELEAAARQISSKVSWNEGWVAVRDTKRFDSKDMKPEVLLRLNYLDMMLKPTTIIERAKLYIFSGYENSLELVDTIENEVDENHQVEEITRSLGQDVAIDDQIFKELLPEILSKDGSGLFVFGQGLANRAKDPEKMWQDFCTQLTFLEEPTRNYMVISGFINAISKLDKELSEKFLNEAVTDRILASAYPLLQTSVEINQSGTNRLKLSVEFGLAPIWLYSKLAFVSHLESICDDDLCELLRLISTKSGGLEVAVKILQKRIHGFSTEKSFSNKITSLGQELLSKYEFSQKFNERDNLDYGFGKMINVCFIGESAKGSARIICKKIIEAYSANKIYSTNYKEVIKALAINQPEVFLDIFLEEDARNDYLIEPMFSCNLIRQVNPMGCIDNNLIIRWCEVNPETRYPIVSSTIMPYQKSEKKDRLEWTPLAIMIINNFHDPITVLNKFKLSFRSRAEMMQSRLCLILDLKEHENSLIADWAFKIEKVFEEEIRDAQELELKMESERNECFE